jgi:hypothetical protein
MRLLPSGGPHRSINHDWWARELPFGSDLPRKPLRIVRTTTDSATLPERARSIMRGINPGVIFPWMLFSRFRSAPNARIDRECQFK